MNILFDSLVFNKKSIASVHQQTKMKSFCYVLGLSIMISLVIILFRTAIFNYNDLQNNVHVEESKGNILIKSSLLYSDSLNKVELIRGGIYYNDKYISNVKSVQDINKKIKISQILSINKIKILILMFIYNYLSTIKFVALMIVLLFSLSWISFSQARIRKDNQEFAMYLTFTSYLLTIPIFLGMFLQLVVLKDSFIFMIVTTLSVFFELAFVKYLQLENENGEKMVE